MKRETIIIQVTPTVEPWGNFKKWCLAKGFNPQTLANKKQVPKVGQPVKIGEYLIYREDFR